MNNETDRATPRPWTCDPTAVGRAVQINGPDEICRGERQTPLVAICDGDGLETRGQTDEELTVEARADAALIVAAVNSFDAMREACMAAAALMDVACTCQKHVPGRCAACKCEEQLNAALALAGTVTK